MKANLFLGEENYIIVRDTPNGLVKISGVFKSRENAINELQKRKEFLNNLEDWQKEQENKLVESGWSKPYLIKLEVKVIPLLN